MKLSEGTWAFPKTVRAAKQLGALLAEPLSAKDASKKLYNLFGDDELFDIIDDAAEDDAPDVRAAIKRRLKKFLGMKAANIDIAADVRATLTKLVEGQLDEKVYTLKNPDIKPRGAPENTARAFDRPGKDRSVLKKLDRNGHYSAIEFSDEGDYIMVLVMSSTDKSDYHGVNVLFYPDGKIDASTDDKLAASQWKNDKAEIIKIAKASLKDETLPGIYHGLGGKSSKRGKGELSFTVKENMITFKQFLLAEGKFKEPGWYVCDHMDKPIKGPMQEGAAKDMAEEMSEDASKTTELKDKLAKLQDDLKAVKGDSPGDDRNRTLIKSEIFDLKQELKDLKGSVPAFYAEHFDSREILRMNEAKVFVQEPYGSGFNKEPVNKGEVLPDQDGNEAEFIGVSDDRKMLVMKRNNKRIEVSPTKFSAKIVD